MGKQKRRHSDEDVLNWAKLYLENKDSGLIFLERKIGVSHSTIWWNFVGRLKRLDAGLFTEVSIKLLMNLKR